MNPYESLISQLLVAGKGVGEGKNSCGGSIEVQHAIDTTHAGKGEHCIGAQTLSLPAWGAPPQPKLVFLTAGRATSLWGLITPT
jgi:hypothetical protein